jgi:hypothetical protein
MCVKAIERAAERVVDHSRHRCRDGWPADNQQEPGAAFAHDDEIDSLAALCLIDELIERLKQERERAEWEERVSGRDEV